MISTRPGADPMIWVMSRSVTIAWLLLAAFVAQPWLAAATSLADCCCAPQTLPAEVGLDVEAETHGCCTAPEPAPASETPADCGDPLEAPSDCDCPRSCCLGLATPPIAPASAPSEIERDGPSADALASGSDLHDNSEVSRLKRPPRALSFA